MEDEGKPKRLILVDSQSLFFMTMRMGIGKFDLFALHELLMAVGSLELAGMPVYVTSQPTMQKTLRTAGFEPVIKPSKPESEDDAYIIERITSLPLDVKEVVVVSADQDFAPHLRAQAKQGVKVYWVATHGPHIAGALEQLFQTGEFKFVDLAAWKERIMKEPLDPKKSRKIAQSSAPQKKIVRLIINGALDDKEEAVLVRALLSLRKRLPKIDYIMKSQGTPSRA